MATGVRKISQLGQPATLSANDRVVVLTNPGNTSIANTQTIAMTAFIKSLGINMPGPYSNDTAANTAGVALMGLYYDGTGIVRIRLS